MQRCLQLAKLGQETVAPNPMVGAVLVYKDKIIGEGYHHRCGEAHAEVNAINAVKDPSLLKKAILYVSLEPCAHQGRTPACSALIIQKKIPKVVIACKDSFDKVAGKGIAMLKNAGVEVVLGVLEKEALHLNRRFFTFYQEKRPYIILKWAETLDGFIDKKNKDGNIESLWITNEYSRMLVHKWRIEEAAILVGTQTAIKDNPQLNVRVWAGKNPVRISFDRKAIFPDNLFLLDQTQPTLIFTEKHKKSQKNLEYILVDDKKTLEKNILDTLYEKEIQSVIIEGGRKVLQSFIDNNLWDEARVFVGAKTFLEGTKAPVFNAKVSEKYSLKETILRIYYNE